MQPCFEVKVSNIPHSISLLILKAGYMYSAVFLCRNVWNSTIHLFIIRFTDKLAYLDIQTELQDCLYEYGFNDKWHKLEHLVLHVLHSDCIKAYFFIIYDEVMLL